MPNLNTYTIDESERQVLLTCLQAADVILSQLGKRKEVEDLMRMFAVANYDQSLIPCEDDRFNETDKQKMFEGALDEGNDLSRKDVASLVMYSWDLTSCIAACSVMDGEHVCEELAQMLKKIHAIEDDEVECVSGEFLRVHGEEGDRYPELLDFAKRMGLINEGEDEVTELGLEYMNSLI